MDLLQIILEVLESSKTLLKVIQITTNYGITLMVLNSSKFRFSSLLSTLLNFSETEREFFTKIILWSNSNLNLTWFLPPKV